MNCKNCGKSVDEHFSGWCVECAVALIAREEAARQSGWQGAWAIWDHVVGPVGEATPLCDAIREAFKAGWSARGLPDPSRHGLPPREECHPLGYTQADQLNRSGLRVAEIYKAFAQHLFDFPPSDDELVLPSFTVLEKTFIAGWNARVDAGEPEPKLKAGIWNNNPDMEHSKDGFIGMCPRCGARIKPLNDGSGDFEACHSCGLGLPEDRIRPHQRENLHP